jgi:hypothetical protein
LAAQPVDCASRRSGWRPLAGLAAVLLSLLLLPAWASAFTVISEPGSGAGQTLSPKGLAVDTGSERIYVADQGDNRIDVFDAASGAFEMAFGWGVADGTSAALQTCTATCFKGISGSGAGQFNGPTQVAVDSLSHDVYVADPNNFRVQKFTPTGAFLLTFGGGVNKTTSGDVCTAGSGHVCGAGSDGTGEGEFSSEAATSIRFLFVAVEPGGTVKVAESNSTISNSKKNYRIQSFEPSGAVISPQLDLPQSDREMAAFTVDASGNYYVVTGGGIAESGIRKYPPGYDPGSDPVPPLIPGREIQAVSVDSTDGFLSAGKELGREYKTIAQYDSSGVGLRRFGYGEIATSPVGLAPFATPSGQVYASVVDRVLYFPFPDPGPIIAPEPCSVSALGNTKATLAAEVNPEGKATTFHFQYVEEESFKDEGGWASPNTKTTPESGSIGSDINLHKASAPITGLTPETTYRCRAVVTNADAPGGVLGKDGAFTTLEPFEILGTWSSQVGQEAATLHATVNPLGIPASGYFEYVDDASFKASGFTNAARAPEAPGNLDFGAGETPQTASAQLSGLEPGTLYHYRVVVDDPLVEPRNSAPRTFHTFLFGPQGLPDDRAYELVSPAQKNSAEVAVPGAAGGLFLDTNVRIQAASLSGEAITYTSWTSFGDAKGAPSSSQYLSKRSAAGWATENVSPPGVLANALVPPFVGFTPDLHFAGFKVEEPPLTPDALSGFPNLYLRDNASGKLRALTTEAPAGGKAFSCLSYAGASADGQRVIFSANAAFAGAPEPKGGFNLYEWTASDGLLHLVSVLPGGAAAKPAARTTFGATGLSSGPGGNCEVGTKIIRHAISADGSRVFWTYGPSLSEFQLMARVGGTETVQLDATQGAAPGPAGSGEFWSASADGSKVFFTAPGKLTADSGATSGAPDLYRYDFDAAPGERLKDLTPGSLTPGAEAAAVRGVLGAGEDGAYVYFAAGGVLSGAEENEQGEKAQAGENNLYLWHQGEGAPRFIATLAGDSSNWANGPKSQTARVSPDGRHLAFLSTASLTGYDNTAEGLPGCGPRCPEAFLYDAEGEELICASCNLSGARPLGPAQLPTWSNPYEQPHYLSDDGSRLFFETGDVLDLGDVNGKRDVYEFERVGSGNCDPESATFNSVSGGCLYLISSGKSVDHSYFVDASASGRDVFFSTRQGLLAADEDENYDVYDARAGGGFAPSPPSPPPCGSAEACRAPAPAPPANASPGTAGFQGPANQVEKPKQAKKHKSKKKGKHGHKHKRANQKRRAGR